MKIRPVILAGGEGKRLAPLSTPTRPKPFIPLPDGQSLMEKTCRRLQHEVFLSPIIIGREQDRYALMNHVRAAGIKPHAILLEDTSRNTAFAVAAVVHYVNQTEPDTMLAFLPADHVIDDIKAWQQAVVAAAGLAYTRGTLTLIGMEYGSFSPELGYLCVKEEEVLSFIEKPESELKLTTAGQWLANSGQFIGTSRYFSAIIAEKSPIIWYNSEESVKNRQKIWEYDLLSAVNRPIGHESFDVAVLQKTPSLCAVGACCGWNDLGTLKNWEAYSKIPLKEQLVKEVRADRPWGYYETLKTMPEYTEKRLFVYPGCRLSRQRHFYRSEHWTVESGTAYVEKDNQKFTLGLYESIKIPPASWHRLVNPSTDMLIIKEIQYGISDEMDIERDEDDYGRI